MDFIQHELLTTAVVRVCLYSFKLDDMYFALPPYS